MNNEEANVRINKFLEYENVAIADKLFEELGYEKTENGYKLKESDCEIRFFELFRNVIILGSDGAIISMSELKAINQKCKELGWLDD